MNVDATTALVPYQGMVIPLQAVRQGVLTPFRDEESPRGGMRFLGYGNPRGGNVYASTGRMVSEAESTGGSVDIYV